MKLQILIAVLFLITIVNAYPKRRRGPNTSTTTTTTTSTLKPSEEDYEDDDASATITKFENKVNPDLSYRYAYETSDGMIREETGTFVDGKDAETGEPIKVLVVSGFYTYKGEDEKIYKVHYTAGENGFQPQGDHFPTPVQPMDMNSPTSTTRMSTTSSTTQKIPAQSSKPKRRRVRPVINNLNNLNF